MSPNLPSQSPVAAHSLLHAHCPFYLPSFFTGNRSLFARHRHKIRSGIPINSPYIPSNFIRCGSLNSYERLISDTMGNMVVTTCTQYIMVGKRTQFPQVINPYVPMKKNGSCISTSQYSRDLNQTGVSLIRMSL